MTYFPTANEVVLCILPATIDPSQSPNAEPSVRTYGVKIYTNFSLDFGDESYSVKDAMPYGMPLRGTGKLMIPWGRYQDYVAQFMDGEKGAAAMRQWIHNGLSNELVHLIYHLNSMNTMCRIWWASEAPELEDIPWELIFQKEINENSKDSNLIFVRGRPPKYPSPSLGLVPPLRLLLCCDNETVGIWETPDWIDTLFDIELPSMSKITIIRHHGSVRDAVHRAITEGIEILHICTNGTISLAYEGILGAANNNYQAVTAHEVSALLRGSRVSILGFSEHYHLSSDAIPLASRAMVLVYKAFAYFGSSRAPLPSMVAPIGPVKGKTAIRFWSKFYSNFAETYDISGAFSEAQKVTPFSPFALFMRHSHGKLFRVISEKNLPMHAPEQMATQLVSSIAAVESAHTLISRYNSLPVPEYLSTFVADEGVRQGKIRTELNPWIEPEGEQP